MNFVFQDDTYKGHVAWQKFAQLGPMALLPVSYQPDFFIIYIIDYKY